jgi:hypothetical protein
MPKNKSRSRALTVLIAIYGVLAFAALGRSSFELATKFAQAPLPYALSTFAAVVYLVATWSLARTSPLSRKIALVSISIELIGVLSVGAISTFQPEWFTYLGAPVHTVWSYFGVGYGYVPVLLPIFGLVYLSRSGSR